MIRSDRPSPRACAARCAPAVAVLRDEIEARLLRAARALASTRRTMAILDEVRLTRRGGGHGAPSVEDVMSSWLRAWIEDVCERESAAVEREGHLRIDADGLSAGVRLSPLRKHVSGAPELEGKDFWKAEPVAAARAVLARLDVGALHREIVALSAGLGVSSRRDAAVRLARLFDLSYCPEWRVDPSISLERSRGCVVLKFDDRSGSGSERIDNAAARAGLARTFERESGVRGLADTFELVRSAEADLYSRNPSYGERIASRTRVRSSNGTSAVFFAATMHVHLPEEVFEALIAFLHDYCDLPVRDIKLA